MTTPNPIEEIKAIRHRLGAEAGYDIHRVFAELRSARDSSERFYVDLSPRIAANHPLQRSGEAVFSEVEDRSSPPAER